MITAEELGALPLKDKSNGWQTNLREIFNAFYAEYGGRYAAEEFLEMLAIAINERKTK